MTINLEHQTFRATVHEVCRAADLLHDHRTRAVRQVEHLLDGGWSGIAADAFADGWADWQRAAADVLLGLAGMAELLDGFHGELTDSDQASGDRLYRLAGRLS
ncbi:MAG: WXG100 family type VII secretion target [Nocardioides sp.]